MNLAHLEAFCRVVERGSFSGAARDLHLSQPSVSQQVQSLEDWAGTRLLVRSGGKVKPTDAGNLLYRRAREILEAAARAKDEVDRLTGRLGGRLRVGASFSIGEYFLPRVLGEFHKMHPWLDLHMRVANTLEIVELIVAAALDVGVVEGAVRRTSVTVVPFMEDQLVLIAAPDHPWAEREAVGVDELARCAWILREPGSGTRAATEESLAAAGVRELQPAMELGSTEAVKSAVEAGLGVSFISQLAVSKELKLGTLRVIPVEGLIIHRHFSLVYSERKYRSAAWQAFIRHVKSKGTTLAG